MTLIANKQLTGDFGTVGPGKWFNADNETAVALIERGLAAPVGVTHYETKVIAPTAQEVKPLPAKPFRDMPVVDEEPPALAALRAAVLSVPDVQTEGDSSSVERPISDGPNSAVSEASAPSGESINRNDPEPRVRVRTRRNRRVLR